MKSRPLTPKDIAQDGLHDLPEFTLLRDFLIASGIEITEVSNGMFKFIQQFDEFFWRPEEIALFARPKTKGMIPTSDVYHHAIHHLLVRRFPGPLTGRPRFILACEAIASCADLYFFLEGMRLGLTEHPDVIQRMEFYVKNAQKLHPHEPNASEMIKLLVQEGIQDPFKKFRTAAFEMIEFYESLFQIALRRIESCDVDLSEVHSTMSNHRHAPLFFHYNYPINILYALVYGGMQSSNSDLAAVDECKRALAASQTFESLLLKELKVTDLSIPQRCVA